MARPFLVSRVLVLAVAVAAAALSGADSSVNAAKFDAEALTHPFGGLGDSLAAPLARWDAVWYLEIAGDGYPGRLADPAAAFFPLYPLLVRVASGGAASPGVLLLAAYGVSLAAMLGALSLLYRLAALEYGPAAGRTAVALAALFPASFFLSAPYSESLFLLVSVGAFYAARTGHWAWAGLLAAAAGATRSAGVVLVVPLLVLYLYGPRADGPPEPRRGGRLMPRHRPRADVLWLALAPLGLAAYAGYLELAGADALDPFRVQAVWHREFAGPFGGVRDGLVAAFEGARQLLSGSREPVFFGAAGGDPFEVARRNLVLAGFLLFALVALAGTLRRLPAAYGAYVLCALALPLSFPVGPQPLMSLPRFLSVLFPIFVWLALVCQERRRRSALLVVSGVLLCIFTAQFASWQQFT